MKTREQLRASQAYDRINQLKQDERAANFYKAYGSMAHRLPILILNAGLVQALEFVQVKGTGAGEREQAISQLLKDLEATLKSTGMLQGSLIEKSRSSQVSEYMLLTREALACLVWYKRYAESVLGIKATENN